MNHMVYIKLTIRKDNQDSNLDHYDIKARCCW